MAGDPRHCCHGNEKVPEPKFQLPTSKRLGTTKCKRNQNSKRSEQAVARRKADRKARRAHRRSAAYRQLKKYQPELATQVGTYHVAQECYSKHDIENPLTHVPSAPEQPPKTKLESIKVASLNLNGGISHMSGREKIVHLMDKPN